MRRRKKKFPTRFAGRKHSRAPNEINITIQKSRMGDFGTVISALSTLGILILALWTALFSDFSKVVVENLTKQNSALRQEKVSLETETKVLESRQSDLRKQITSSSEKLAQLELDAKSKQEKLTRLSKEIEDKNSTIDTLSYERISLAEQTTELESELIENQKTLFLSRLPIDGQKYGGIPYYMILMINDGYGQNGMWDSLSTYAEAAYNDMTKWLADMDEESTTPHQISAYAFIQKEFDKRCGNKSEWINIVTNPNASELDFIEVERKEFERSLLKIEDKMDRAVAETQNLNKRREHIKAESEFYFSHMSESVGKCFNF